MTVVDPQPTRITVPPSLWEVAIRRFASRNRGRPARLRVESFGETEPGTDTGALLDAGFLPVCDRVEVTLGDDDAPYGRVTRTGWNVHTIERSLDREGRETGFDVAYDRGRMRVRLEGESALERSPRNRMTTEGPDR